MTGRYEPALRSNHRHANRILLNMPNWRRAHVPGGTFFFTVVTGQCVADVVSQLLDRLRSQCS